jgi:hypothetical protein
VTHPESVRCVLDDRQPGRPVDGPRSLVCKAHRELLAELLDPAQRGQMHHKPDERRILPSIPVLFLRLPVERGRGGEQSTRFVPQSTPPGDLTAMALRDRRSVVDDTSDPGAPMSALGTLAAIAVRLDLRDVDNRPVRWPTDVAPLAAWLHLRLDHLCAVDWVDAVWNDLNQLHGQLAGPAGDPRPRPVISCQKLVDTRGRPWPHDPTVGLRDDGPYECGAPIYLPSQPLKGGDEPLALPETLRGRECGGVYTRAEYKRIGFKRGIEVPA